SACGEAENAEDNRDWNSPIRSHRVPPAPQGMQIIDALDHLIRVIDQHALGNFKNAGCPSVARRSLCRCESFATPGARSDHPRNGPLGVGGEWRSSVARSTSSKD